MEEFIMRLYKAECRQNERYERLLRISLIANAVLLGIILIGR